MENVKKFALETSVTFPYAEIAIQTVQDYQKKNQNSLEVVFNVFKDSDYKIYKQLLG